MKKGKLVARGTTASKGLAAGVVRVVDHDPELSMNLKPGEILVAAYTSPDHVPAMKKAAGIVTESGGIMSHAAIVSREFGVPAIVGISGILDPEKGLKNGQRIVVDATEGAIYEDLEPAGEDKLATLAARNGIDAAKAFLEKMRNRG